MTPVNYERRCAGDGGRRFFLVLLWIVLVTVTRDCEAGAQRDADRKQGRLKDQQISRSGTSQEDEDSALAESKLENICDIQSSLSAYCICDSLTLHDANEAKCSVFNVSDQNDSIWESFKTQAGLQELQLNVHEDGRLNFLPAVALRNLPDLTSLQVRDATIDTLASQTFVDVTQLHELRLNRNKIRHIRPLAFQGLSRTVELELSDNELSSLERGVFSGLDNLRKLFLDGNNISLVEDSVFQNLRKLEELDLSGNSIAVLTGETLMGLQQLKKLILRGNQLAIVGDHTFAHVSNLRRLDLSSNQLQVIRQQALAGLRHLNNLDLSRNQLKGLDKSAMLPIWSNLVNSSMTFSIEGNPLLCDCRSLWILRDLRMSSTSVSVNAGIDRLNCTGLASGNSSTNLITSLSVLDCRPPAGSTATTRRPSRGSTSTSSTHAEEQPKLPVMVNASSASLQLSSPVESKEVRPQDPVSSAATNTALPEQASSAPIAGAPIATICFSLVFASTALL
ncbi:hypothetical protein GHT06_011653 [Daphnia sinensis]|uniref:Uncharacterized protein n=1 Tax=Daphnia sinensis TaxID=1820382 RepID=A0AAD5LMU3_9CRUS|nr:hypothetical protein GHT06_011653 [Daphnia sinensis]